MITPTESSIPIGNICTGYGVCYVCKKDRIKFSNDATDIRRIPVSVLPDEIKPVSYYFNIPRYFKSCIITPKTIGRNNQILLNVQGIVLKPGRNRILPLQRV